MPFGYALEPHTFSKCVEAALVPLRRQGIRLLVHIDDLLVLAPSAELAIAHTTQTVIHRTRVGVCCELGKECTLAQSSDCLSGIAARLCDYEGSNFGSLSGCPVASPTKVSSESHSDGTFGHDTLGSHVV
jgi:hypothetical protein